MAARRWWIGLLCGAIVLLVGCSKTTRLTFNSTPEGVRCFETSISADGRYVGLTTLNDPSGLTQDQQTMIRKVSDLSTVKLAGNGDHLTGGGAVTRDGGAVVLWIANRAQLWNRSTGVFTPVSPSNEAIDNPVISADGGTIAYQSAGVIWRYDVKADTREQVSPSRPGDSTYFTSPRLSADGRYVTYKMVELSSTVGLTVIDTQSGSTWQLIGAFETGGGGGASISNDGRWVAYAKHKPGDPPGSSQIYLWDRISNSSTRLTNAATTPKVGGATISGDGSRVAYVSADWVARTGKVVLVERATLKSSAPIDANYYVHGPVLSDDGHTMALCTAATNLVSPSPAAPNIYVWTDR